MPKKVKHRPVEMPPPGVDVYTDHQAAAYLGLASSVWLQHKRMNVQVARNGTDEGPPFVRVGRLVRYLKSDLDAWLAARRVTQTPAAAPKSKRLERGQS
jgi:predicted DNA-binding transcriptional regulator AlpA